MGLGSNFVWSEGAGEGREDDDRVSNQVGGLIIAESGFIRSSYSWVISLISVLVYLIALLDGILTSTAACFSVL